MAFRCTNCNGDIRFDIESQLMKCDHCGSTFDPDSFRVRNVSDEEVLRDQGLTLFLCSGCGAELQGTEESEVGFCPYCGGQSFLKKGSGGGEVENILPFQITKDRCAELFRQYARGVRYLPKDMKRPEHLDLPRNIQEVPNSEEYLIESGKDVLLPQDAFGGRGNRLSCRSRRPIRTVNTKSMESQGRSGSIRSIPMTSNMLGENQVLTRGCKRCMISMIR